MEARNVQQELFGFRRLQIFLTEHGLHGPAPLKGLLDELGQFTGPEEDLEDDLTLVMLERRGK